MEEVRARFSEISEEIVIASGSIQTNLMDIPISYLGAKETLKKYIYYGSENPDTASDQNVTSNRDNNSLNSLQEMLEKGEIHGLESLCKRVLDDLQSHSDSITSFITGCSDILDILVAKLYVGPGMNAKQSTEYASYYIELEKMGSKNEAFAYMQSVLTDLITALENEYNRSQHKIVSAAKEYIRLHYSDSNLAIHQIADSVGITDAYLSSIFTEYTGENLVTYLNRFRVDMAKELLINTKIIIKDVGYKTGFYTVQNFNRVFKRFTGMTPGEFRKNTTLEK